MLFFPIQDNQAIKTDQELEMVSTLADTAFRAGVCGHVVTAVNLYIALKSRSLVILTGSPNSGKAALVKCLARHIMGGECVQCQMLAGHPWQAEKSGNLSFSTGLHYRFTSEKLLSLVEEAWQPENRMRVFLACLAHISPGELVWLFTELAHQARFGELVCLGDIHLVRPVPFPPNLFLVGTLDQENFTWWDEDLLSGATILEIPAAHNRQLTCSTRKDGLLSGEKTFLRSIVRRRDDVLRKIHAVLAGIRQPLLPLFRIEALLEGHGITGWTGVRDDVLLYLANAWTFKGSGLFSAEPAYNLEIALDFAIAQMLLPRLIDKTSCSPVYGQLYSLLAEQFPRSTAFLVRSLTPKQLSLHPG